MLELRRDAEAFGDFLADVDVEPNEGPIRLQERLRGVVLVGRDAQHTGVLDLLEQVACCAGWLRYGVGLVR